jgi:hypothetical protein
MRREEFAKKILCWTSELCTPQAFWNTKHVKFRLCMSMW